MVSCSSDESDPCPTGPLFTVSPVALDSIAAVVPLGNLNPPGHVFPSDHGGLYVVMPGPLSGLGPELRCPGDLTIVRMRAVEHVNEGLTDFALYFRICDDVEGYLGHIASLDPDTFGELADYSQWPEHDEYSTGGETYRNSYLSTSFEVEAGTRLGTTRHMDFGLTDLAADPWPAATPSRWGVGSFRYGRHFLDYYADGPLRDALLAKVDRTDVPGDPYPLGRILQDVPGTAQGSWFLPGAPFPPEDEHLALVQASNRAEKQAISIGTAMSATIRAGVWFFTPVHDGVHERAFAEVTPDGVTYGYRVPDPDHTIFLTMPDEETLWIEAVEGYVDDPAAWVFTDHKVEYKR